MTPCLPGGLSRAQIEETLQLKADVVIPDLPRQAGLSASLGDPAVISKGAFRQGILQIAREVAFTRSTTPDIETGGRWRRLFGGRRQAA